ncbi:hypothetical protein PQ743_02720 [Thermoanaerobacterium thermosaccharolyticum]|uniref:DUF6608 family protein n=1 Tax=Thermoanaerobacterium thermosaccharolyticum TaxID=1517 RepID=UPI002FDA2F59
MKRRLFNAVFLICTLFFIATIGSSTIQLLQQRSMDSNLHILLRGGICIVAVVFIEVFRLLKFKNIIVELVIQYLVTMSLIFLMVYMLGYFAELAKTAYRDIFLNYTVGFVVVSAIIIIYKKRKLKK